jgi:hypothetical protein
MTLLAFLHPALIGFAALAAVPLIIHLLNRRRYRTVPWAAMDFLLAAYKKKRKRLELENLLLLLLRCAIPVILALVFARPYFGADSLLSSLAEPRREVVLVVDESYSMSRRVGASTQFQAALEQCRRLAGSLDFERGDRVSLLTLAREPRLLCVSGSAGDLEHKLATLARPTYEPADLGRTLDVILDDLMKQIPAQPEIWLISDFQRRTFEDPGRVADDGKSAATPPAAPVAAPPAAKGAVADAPASNLGKLQRLSQQARLHLVNLSDGTLPPENLAVTDLRANEPLAITGQALRFTASITRSGRMPGGSGHFRIGDQDRPVNFTFDAEGKATVEIYHACTTAGDVGVEFRLDEDELADDDARFLRLPVKPSLPILVVDGNPSGVDPLSGDAWNLILVLDPQFGKTDAELATSHKWFEPTSTAWYDLTRTKPDFSHYDAVVFVNVQEIDAVKVLPELQTYVESGGGALFFLGDKIRPESYNEHLFRADGSGLLPLRLAPEAVGEAWSSDPRSVDRGNALFRLEIADELHPAVRTFADDRRRAFLRSPVFRYWPFAVEPDAPLPADTRVVLRFEKSQAPALVDHRVGRGRTLWSAVSGAADDWSNFSRTPAAFFPLVWDMLNYLAVRDPGEHDLTVGATIAKGLAMLPATATMTPPGGKPKPLGTALPKGGSYHLPAYADTKVPGLYSLDVAFGGDDVPLHELYAVNVDARESDLRFLDAEQIPSVFDRVTIASYGREVSIERGAKEPERQGEIWKRLAIALLILILLETVLAWRFGRFTS